jgi:esterase/lipase
MKEFFQDWFTIVLMALGALWAVIRFAFEPHVRRVVRAAGVAALEERATKLEETMRTVEATMEARDERDSEFRAEMRRLQERQTVAIEAISKEVTEQGKAVSRIDGTLRGMERRSDL